MKDKAEYSDRCKKCGHFIWKHKDSQGRCGQFSKNPKRKCKCEKFV